MKPGSAPDFFLIAHSHGVSLLDGATDWRGRLRAGAASDPRYGAAFQGWFQGSIPRTPFEACTVGDAAPRRIVAWVISSASGIGPLVALRQAAPGKTDVQPSPEYERVLSSWRGSVPIVSMIHGNEHWPTLLNMWPPFDFVDAAGPDIEPGVPIVDEAFVDAQVEPWVAAAFLPLQVLKRLVPNPLAHVLPPPPREKPEASPYLEKLKDHVARYGFAPDGLRLKWYRRYCRRLSERLASIGCTLFHPPSQACNAAGLLQAGFAEGLTHGNQAYGRLTAQRIESWLEGLRA